MTHDLGGGAGDCDAAPARARGLTAESVRLAQAGPDDPEGLQKMLAQEHDRVELLARELTIHQHLGMLLTLYRARAEAARFKPESEDNRLPERLQQEQLRLTQAAESGAAELCRVLSEGAPEQSQQTAEASDTNALQTSLQQQRDRADRLEQDLLAAKRDVAAQTALVAEVTEQAAQAKGQAERDAAGLRESLQHERERAAQLEKDVATAQREVDTQTALASEANKYASQAKRAENDAAELGRSLQQEQERAAQLEKDLATARRDVKTQSALASQADQAAAQLKQVADQGSAELKQSLQKEHERAEALAKELSIARTTIYAYEAQARKASDQAAASVQAGENVAVMRKSLQQEQERAGRLEQDLASARRDVETQTALAAKANDDAAQSKQAAGDSAELKRSRQKEHDRAEVLARDLSMVHTAIYTYELQARIASKQVAARAQSAEGSASELRKTLQDEQARAERLLQDLAVARRNLETQTAVAAEAGAEAARLKRSADDNSAESQRSLQQERDKTARLERQLTAERKKDACAASGPVTAVGATQDKTSAVDAIRPVATGKATATGAPGNPKPEAANAVEVERLVARASVLLGQGDIGSARIVLERAADTGSAQASFALAETYDPRVLRRWGAYGTLGDPVKARDLYARAQAGGIKEAKERFDALR
jgi:hypothetical protein